jgi:hypothetical protein
MFSPAQSTTESKRGSGTATPTAGYTLFDFAQKNFKAQDELLAKVVVSLKEARAELEEYGKGIHEFGEKATYLKTAVEEERAKAKKAKHQIEQSMENIKRALALAKSKDIKAPYFSRDMRIATKSRSGTATPVVGEATTPVSAATNFEPTPIEEEPTPLVEEVAPAPKRLQCDVVGTVPDDEDATPVNEEAGSDKIQTRPCGKLGCSCSETNLAVIEHEQQQEMNQEA